MHLSARPSPIKRSSRPTLPRPQTSVPRTPAQVVRRPVTPPLAAPPPARKQPHRVVELSNQGCRWPIGHPGEAGFHFCNERALVGKPYCADHAAMGHGAGGMNHSMRDFDVAPQVKRDPSVQSISPMPVDRTGEPG